MAMENGENMGEQVHKERELEGGNVQSTDIEFFHSTAQW